MHLAVQILLIAVSPGLLAILAWFALEWRKVGGGGKEARQLRQELTALRRDYEQSKALQNDALLGLEAGLRRLEDRVDRLAGIEAPPPVPVPQTPSQRQL